MPHAIERSVASPTISARLPARNPMAAILAGRERHYRLPQVSDRRSGAQGSLAAPDGDALARFQQVALREAVPREELRHRNAETLGDMRKRVTPAHRVGGAGPVVRHLPLRSLRAARTHRELAPGAQR